MIYRPHHAFSHHEAVPNQFRTPGSFLVSRGGSLLESAEGQMVGKRLTWDVLTGKELDARAAS
jgi:hypothetical protein